MTPERSRIARLEAELEETYRSVTELTNELERAKEDLRRTSLHDSLTELPNRSLFLEQLDRTMALARREKQKFPVLAMDLNGFKAVNDTLGHAAGDALLQEVARRLRSVVRESDMIARLGGDEFIALLMTARDLQGAVAVAEKILRVMERPLFLEGETVEVGISIGIGLFPDHGGHAAALLNGADQAMYDAKRRGCGYAVLDSHHDLASLRRALLPGELRRAIEGDELALVFQPKIDLMSGRVVGAEALARWNHPTHGFLMPEDFIPVIEHTAVLRPFTLAVLRGALEQSQAWRRRQPPLALAINLSSKSLYDRDLPDRILDLLRQSDVDPNQLILEITESALQLDPDRALEAVTRLCSTGVGIAIDDFGTGYSCLGKLKDIPLAEIKIGMPFVHSLSQCSRDYAAVRSIIGMCDALGIRAVAEGVEREDTYATLRKLGCHSAQGFLISRPLVAGEFERWIENRDRAPQCEPRQRAAS